MSLIPSPAVRTLVVGRVVKATLSTFDAAAAFAIAGNGVAVVTGVATAGLIVKYFSPELQGYYYAFGSIASLHVLAEFGFGQTTVQFASHEWANLRFDHQGEIVGDRCSRTRLDGLAAICRRWYGIGAIAAAAALVFGGSAIVAHSKAGGIEWRLPWIVFALGIGANLALAPFFCFVQACLRRSMFWLYRLIHQAVYGSTLCVMILGGAKLWALSGATWMSVAFSMYWVFAWSRMTRLVLRARRNEELRWRRDIWPTQWRVAMSWVATNFTASFLVLIAFAVVGPVAAGQIGLTSAMNALLLAIASNLVVTKFPIFAQMAARRSREELDELFRTSLASSAIVSMVGGGCIWTVGWLLYTTQHPVASRLLSPAPLALFLVATVLSTALAGVGSYLRAHKAEPLAGVNCTAAVLVVVAAVACGRYFGAVGIMSSYLAVVALFQFPAAWFIYTRRRKQWRRGLEVATGVNCPRSSA